MTYQFEVGWPCPKCGLRRGEDHHDPCLGELPGVRYACCGHADYRASYPYLSFENGVRIGVIVTSISYDDGRPPINYSSEELVDRLRSIVGKLPGDVR